ncbi:MAG: PQQ-dependent sugar dehydrogenase, partial [Chitinophagales bacterium]|nr:PQQ-dependent sugar dehydrogenase [Chitinophagales bacterium]
MKFYLTAIIFCFISLKSFSQTPQIELKLFSSGWTSPIDIKNCGDSRLFIVQQKGYVYICDSLGIKNPIAFLDISAKTATDAGGERGMLGIVFHPDYFNNGHFFVYYTKKSNGDLIVARYNVDSTNKNLADPNSELILLQVPHPTYGNHNGGCLQFGPDGYLYTGMGDGGSGGDPNENAQNPQKYLGKLLRIDVNSETGYVVPPDNPFINDPSFLPEIWTYGMRNPWRFSFDKITGDLWVGDVGQNTWEEVDYVEAPDSGGQNYGWDCYEATHDYEPLNCNASDSVLWPVFEYKHNGGSNGDCSITGGYVYRGSQYANMYGKYIFADYCSGIFRCIVKNNDGTFTTTNVGDELITQDEFDFSTFGVSNTGELYVADISHGKIY